MTMHKPLRTLAIATFAAVFMLAANAATDKSASQQAADSVVTAKVKTALVGDPLTKAHDIDVEVFKGRVQLNGFVASDAERKQAGSLAKAVDGVVGVDNNLALKDGKRSAGAVVDDATLTVKVKAALAKDDRTKAHQINVETRNSVVMLAGFVNTKADIMAANDIARSVTGVARVDNQLAAK